MPKVPPIVRPLIFGEASPPHYASRTRSRHLLARAYVKKVDRQEPVAPPFVVFADAGPT
jgi:hypothetical protein